MKKKIDFWTFLINWCFSAFVLGLINTFFIKISLLHNLIMASLGLILLIYPIYPKQMEVKYTEKKCRIFIRIVAVIEILLAFATRTIY